MKTTILQIALFALVSSMATAQDKSEKAESKVRIKVEKEIDGKKQIYERSFDATGMSQDEKNRIMEKIQDSILADSKGKNHKLKIEVEEGDNRGNSSSNYSFHFDDNYGDDKDDDVFNDRKSSPKFRILSPENTDDFMKEFRLQMDDMGKNFRDFNFNMPDPLEGFGGNSAGSKTIKDLSIYPNRPKAETLNIKFYAPKKGNVLIKVMDTKGAVIAKDEVKDFMGEYVGQIEIPKSEGVVFVMVTQGEDGTVKRVQLSKEE
jgi:Fe-S cluster assembly iron-binding protein IscA